MSRDSIVRRAVLAALLGAAAQAAIAQDAAGEAALEEIVVTGSRIALPNMQSISPVSSISAADIAVTGKARVEDIINSMPQVFAAQGANVSNGSNGTATLSLRNLGARRTLVLVNGRRLGPGDAGATASNASDVNQIPAELIERVEVLTGGASAVYGADAVAGVINFMMDTKFEGVKVAVNYGFYNHENDNAVGQVVRDRFEASGENPFFAPPEDNVNVGYTKSAAFTVGMNTADGRGNATAYLTWREIDPILQKDFDYSACTFNSGYDDGDDPGAFTCGGSNTTFPGRFRTINPADPALLGSLTLDGASSTPGALRAYSATLDQYNFGPLNYYQRPDERWTGGAFAHYEVNEHADVYTEVMFMRDRSVAQIAPSGSFGQQYTFACDNPLWTAAQRQAFCGVYGLDTADGTADTVDMLIFRRNVEGGGRQSDFSHSSLRLLAGVRGDINDAWKYDAYAQQATTSLAQVYLNDFSITKLGRSLDVVSDGNGGAVCRSVVDGTDPACVPWNIWRIDGVTPAATNYLNIPLLSKGEATERVASASFTGDLGQYGLKLPGANDGLRINVGVEWRSVEIDFQPDQAYQNGDGAGQGAATLPIGGGYRVKEAYLEGRLPILEGRSMAESLSAEFGYRYSDYSRGWNTDTYKFGLEYSPVPDVRLRASYQQAVRVPNIGELLAVQQVALDGVTDPCAVPEAGVGTPALSLEQCQRTGMTASQYGIVEQNPAAQYNGLVGGNPDLEPETAKTTSFGLAWQPSFIDGLRLQVDYFDIEIEDAIQNPNPDFTLLLCAFANNPTACGRIHRDEFGSLWLSPTNAYVVDTLENIGSVRTKGIDFDASYAFEIGNLGRLSFALQATRLDTYEVEPQLGVSYDCVGYYGPICGVPLPDWRHTFRTTWSTPWSGLDLSLAWRYFGDVELETNSSNVWLGTLGELLGVARTDSKFASRSYLDLTASMKLADRYSLRLGINNLLDKDPPLTGQDNCPVGPCNGNSWPQIYDATGRFVFMGVTAEF